MYKSIKTSCGIFVILLVAFLFAEPALEGSETEDPVEVLVQFSDRQQVDQQLQKLKEKLKLTNNRNVVQFKYTNVLGGALLRLPPEKLSLLMDQDQQIHLIESDKKLKPISSTKTPGKNNGKNQKNDGQDPSDLLKKQQSKIRKHQILSENQLASPNFKINGDHAGKAATSNVNVAVIDTGIASNHPDLDDNVKGGVLVKKTRGDNEGIEFDTNPDQWNDKAGHGTHVAGIIAAEDNGKGVVGVAPHANLYGVKLSNMHMNYRFLSELAAGIDWLADEEKSPEIDVVNMSLRMYIPLNVKRRKKKLNQAKQEVIRLKKTKHGERKKLRKKFERTTKKINQIKRKLDQSEEDKQSTEKIKTTLKELQSRKTKLRKNLKRKNQKIRDLKRKMNREIPRKLKETKREWTHGTVLKNVIRDATEQGMTIVGAAGNESQKVADQAENYQSVPAAFPDVITISALSKSNKFASTFSNFGNRIDLSAPGVQILSTVPQKSKISYHEGESKTFTKQYGRKSGTSMAAPYVTGAVAQFLSAAKAEDHDPEPKQVQRALKKMGKQPEGGWPNDPDNETEPLVNPEKASKGKRETSENDQQN